MDILLTPQRRDDTLKAVRRGDTLTVNGENFDFSPIKDGDTLPRAAIDSEWIVDDVERKDGELRLTLLLPNPRNYSPEQAFPVPLLNVPDGQVMFPEPLPVLTDGEPIEPERGALPEWPVGNGTIDWTKLVTAEMKAAARAAAHLSEVKAELAIRNAKAATQIARIQDRIDTLGYGIDAGEAAEEDEAEQAALVLTLKAWKTYKFALGKVTGQATWPVEPVWPVEPSPPSIPADPEARAVDPM
jgi:hypothetical protein